MTYPIGVLIYFVGVGLTLGAWSAFEEPDELATLAAFGWPFSAVIGVGYLLGRLFLFLASPGGTPKR